MLYAERKDWDLFWMVDPLDGTVEFIKGNGEFTVNIALMADNRPVFGVRCCVPQTDILSDSDLGAFRSCNTEADPEAEYVYAEITAGAEALPLTDCRNRPLKVAVSRSHSDGETARHLEELRKRHPDAEVLQQGSSYKLCLIAEGSVTTIRAPPRPTNGTRRPADPSSPSPAEASIRSTTPPRSGTTRSRWSTPASPAAANGSVTEPRQSPSQPYGDVPSGTSPVSYPGFSHGAALPLQARTDNYRSAASRFRSGEQLPAIAAARNIARRGVQSVEFARLLNNAFDTPRTHVLVLAYLRLDIMSLEYQRQRHSHHEKSDQPDRYQYDYKRI